MSKFIGYLIWTLLSLFAFHELNSMINMLIYQYFDTKSFIIYALQFILSLLCIYFVVDKINSDKEVDKNGS